MRSVGILFLIILLSSCGGGKNSTPIISFSTLNLQTDTKYDIQITNVDSLSNVDAITLKLFSEEGEELNSHHISYEIMAEQGKEIILIGYSISRTNDVLERNIPIKLELKLDDSSDVVEQTAFLWDLPQIEELNMPQRGALVSDKTINAMGDTGSVYFYWVNLPAWTPPADPNWQEDPFGNISWRLYYHSLGWLTSYVELYERTNNEAIRISIDNYLKDYDETFEDPFNTHVSLAYREDSVSLRINHLLYIYFKLYRNLPEKERLTIESLINKDILLLQVYLDEESWDNKNHGMIQARSALNLVASFPFHPDIESLEVSTHRRLTALSEQLFSPEGYVVEQATGYHFIGLSMMLEAKQQLDTFGMSPNESLRTKIRKALQIAPYLLYHNGTTPAIGDTSYGKNWHGYLKRYYSQFGESIDELENYIETRHEYLDDLKVIGDEGLVIAKHIPVYGNMSKVFFDAGKARLIHGHYDHLNLVASLAGEPLLVDSGGPYTYSKAGGRDKWRYRSAHNTLVAEGEEVGDYSANIVSYNDNDEYIAVSGSAKLQKDLAHHRGFILTKEEIPLLIVVDSVQQTSNPIGIKEYWHFAPGTEINMIETGRNIITVESKTNFYHYHLSNNENSCSIAEGEYDESGIPSQGWVTPKYNVLQSAPVIKCIENTNDYLKINLFTQALLSGTPTFYKIGENVIINIGDRQFTFSLSQNKFLN